MQSNACELSSTDLLRMAGSPEFTTYSTNTAAADLHRESSSDLEAHSDSDSQIYDAPPPESPTLRSTEVQTQTLDTDLEVAEELFQSHNSKHTQTTKYNRLDADVWIPESIDSALFRYHYDQVDWTYSEMRCYVCRNNVKDCMSFKIKRRMAYCADCEYYFCESCVKKDKGCFCWNSLDDLYITEFIT